MTIEKELTLQNVIDTVIEKVNEHTSSEIKREVGELAAMTAREFSKVYKRFDVVDERLDRVEDRLDNLENRTYKIETHLGLGVFELR